MSKRGLPRIIEKEWREWEPIRSRERVRSSGGVNQAKCLVAGATGADGGWFASLELVAGEDLQTRARSLGLTSNDVEISGTDCGRDGAGQSGGGS